MRMWMVPVKILCDKHLRGEHVEHHMFMGTLQRKISVQGYIDNNLFEPLSLFDRHTQLANEMIRRGMNHKSPLSEMDAIEAIEYLSEEIMYTTVDKNASLEDLLDRCPECRARYDKFIKGEL